MRKSLLYTISGPISMSVGVWKGVSPHVLLGCSLSVKNVRPFPSHVFLEIRWCSVSDVYQVYQKVLLAIPFCVRGWKVPCFHLALQAMKHLLQVPWVWSAVADQTSNLVAKSSPSDMKVLSQGLQDNPEWYPAPQQMDQRSGDNLDFWWFVIKNISISKVEFLGFLWPFSSKSISKSPDDLCRKAWSTHAVIKLKLQYPFHSWALIHAQIGAGCIETTQDSPGHVMWGIFTKETHQQEGNPQCESLQSQFETNIQSINQSINQPTSQPKKQTNHKMYTKYARK